MVKDPWIVDGASAYLCRDHFLTCKVLPFACRIIIKALKQDAFVKIIMPMIEKLKEY